MPAERAAGEIETRCSKVRRAAEAEEAVVGDAGSSDEGGTNASASRGIETGAAAVVISSVRGGGRWW